MVRPSMSTSSLLAVVPLKPRALMAHWRESTCATCRLEARRRASARLDAPERRMSCCVITWIAEAVCDNRSGRFETEVTCRSINCSILSFFNAAADTLESGHWRDESALCGVPGRKQERNHDGRTSHVPPAWVFLSGLGRFSPPPALFWAAGMFC